MLAHLLLLIAFVIGNANAQMTLKGAGVYPVAAAAYTGPGDIVSGASSWWGLRAYNAASRGSAAINVCIASDVACGDLSTDATTGNLVTSTLIGGSACSVVTCTIKTMYDQTGNGRHVTMATEARRPTLSTACLNSNTLACAVFSKANLQRLRSASTITRAVPYTLSVVAERTGNTTISNMTLNLGITTAFISFDAANTVTFSPSASTTASANDNAWHAMQGIAAASNAGFFYVDGLSSSNYSATIGLSGAQIDISDDGFQEATLDGKLVEAGFWPSGFSVGNASSMNSNQHIYWGF